MQVMEAGLRYLPDRVPDPAALAGEVSLLALFGGGGSGSDSDTEAKQDEAQDGAPRQVFVLASGVPLLALPVPARGIAFQLWPSALALCGYLEDAAAAVVRGRRCLELGAGLATVGIAAAVLGAARVYVSDLPAVCAHMEANVRANPACLGGGSLSLSDSDSDERLPRYSVGWALAQATARTVPLALPWGDEGAAAAAALRGHVDVVLASDVVYWEHLHAPLLTTLRQLTDLSEADEDDAAAPPPPPILLAQLRRRRADRHFFRAASRWFDVEVVAEPAVPTYRERIQVYRLVRRSRAARARPSPRQPAA
jgi:predicted nicotinamide N-methyase